MIREDRVMMVSRPDNTLIVDHNDGTRITTFYKEQQLPPPTAGGATGGNGSLDPTDQQDNSQQTENQGTGPIRLKVLPKSTEFFEVHFRDRINFCSCPLLSYTRSKAIKISSQIFHTRMGYKSCSISRI